MVHLKNKLFNAVFFFIPQNVSVIHVNVMDIIIHLIATVQGDLFKLLHLDSALRTLPKVRAHFICQF